MTAVIITSVLLMAVSAMEFGHTGPQSGCSPDPKRARFSPIEILEAVVRHARPQPVFLARLAEVDKTHLKLVRDILHSLRHQRLSQIVMQLPTSRDNFIRNIKWLINICREGPSHVAVLRDLLTEETAPLFMYRLLSIVIDEPEVIMDLFDVIGHLESVSELKLGWVLVVYRCFCMWNLEAGDTVKLMCLQVLRQTTITSFNHSINDIPDYVLDIVRMSYYGRRAAATISVRGRLQDPFAAFSLGWVMDVAFVICRDHGHDLRSRPVLARKLFFFGTPIHLDWMNIAEFTVSDLDAILPFALYVPNALAKQIHDLIESGRSDLIMVILRSESFFSPPLNDIDEHFSCLQQILRSLIEAEGQHELLRMLLEAPLPDGWVAGVGSWSDVPILHRAVQAGNADAVRVLLEFPDSIKTNIVDYNDRTARSYTEPGSEIDTLFNDATVLYG